MPSPSVKALARGALIHLPFQITGVVVEVDDAINANRKTALVGGRVRPNVPFNDETFLNYRAIREDGGHDACPDFALNDLQRGHEVAGGPNLLTA